MIARLCVSGLATFLVLLGLLTHPGHGSAATTAGAPIMQVQQTYPHGYIEETRNPGEGFSVQIRVLNAGAVPADFLLSGVDGYTSSASGIVYGNRQTPFRDGPQGNGEYGAGRWITLSAGQAHLDPGQSQLLTVAVAVPPATPPGDWVGGVTGESTQLSSAGGQGPGLTFTEATEIAVVVHVPGPTSLGTMVMDRPSITIEAVQEFLDIPLRYTGDVITKPLYSFTIRDAGGRTVYSHSGRFDSFMPHTTLRYRVLLKPPLDPGRYAVSGTVGPDRSQQTAAYPVDVTGQPVALPGDAPRGAAAAQGLWARRGIELLVATGSLVAILALVGILARRRCTHCGRTGPGSRLVVHEFQEISACSTCRGRALARRTVRLCGSCYREHVLARSSATP